TGRIYLSDPGEADYEEINEINGGDRLGWPWREGPMVMFRGSCPEPYGYPFVDPIVAYARGPELTAFIVAGMYRNLPSAASNWPAAYDGDVFYGEYYSGFLRRIHSESGTWGAAAAVPGQPNPDDWGTGFVSAVDYVMGPDGSLWWLRQFDDNNTPHSGAL